MDDIECDEAQTEAERVTRPSGPGGTNEWHEGDERQRQGRHPDRVVAGGERAPALKVPEVLRRLPPDVLRQAWRDEVGDDLETAREHHQPAREHALTPLGEHDARHPPD